MTLDKAALQAVIERLEKATGPDRELDARIHAIIELPSSDWEACEKSIISGDGLVTWHYLNKSQITARAPSYTASIDAAIALTERMLPGWARVFKYLASQSAYVFLIEYERGEDGLWWHNTGEHLKIKASHKTEPLALLLALFKALLAKEE